MIYEGWYAIKIKKYAPVCKFHITEQKNKTTILRIHDWKIVKKISIIENENSQTILHKMRADIKFL